MLLSVSFHVGGVRKDECGHARAGVVPGSSRRGRCIAAMTLMVRGGVTEFTQSTGKRKGVWPGFDGSDGW